MLGGQRGEAENLKANNSLAMFKLIPYATQLNSKIPTTFVAADSFLCITAVLFNFV